MRSVSFGWVCPFLMLPKDSVWVLHCGLMCLQLIDRLGRQTWMMCLQGHTRLSDWWVFWLGSLCLPLFKSNLWATQKLTKNRFGNVGEFLLEPVSRSWLKVDSIVCRQWRANLKDWHLSHHQHHHWLQAWSVALLFASLAYYFHYRHEHLALVPYEHRDA